MLRPVVVGSPFQIRAVVSFNKTEQEGTFVLDAGVTHVIQSCY
jgi:hypothetical protein